MPVRDRVAPAVLIAALLLTGCGPGSPPPAASGTPTSTVTPDAEEAAFRAAEATYRAYVDALNDRRSNPDSAIDPHTYLDGDAARSAEETAHELAEAGMRVIGRTEIVWIESSSTSRAESTLKTCVDLSNTRLVDAESADVTPASRPDRQVLAVMVAEGGRTITNIVVEPERC